MTDLGAALDEAPLGRFHSRAVITAGMGFFTDAYDLFIIGVATTLIAKQWGLGASATGLVNSATLVAAFVGAFVFGRVADVIGRQRIYGLEALLMIGGALASAFAPSLIWLLVFRFVLGIGVGGDYPVSATIITEMANRKNRGRLVGLVFSMQALGTVAGYVAGLTLLAAGVPDDITWRLLLGLGAVPAAGVLYLRRTIPESPRYLLRVAGDREAAVAAVAEMARVDGVVRTGTDAFGSAAAADGTVATVASSATHGVRRRGALHERSGGERRPAKQQGRLPLRVLLAQPRVLLYLFGTAGSWFLFDYAYYGNSVSAPLIVKSVIGAEGSNALIQALALQLIVFAVAAVPGYYLAVLFMDRIGHKRLQLVGFAGMAVAFLLIGTIPGITGMVTPFLVLFGTSYFFAEFGPNTATFVLSAEVFPTNVRSTCHGISAGIAKLGAFIGVYLFPVIKSDLGVSGALRLSAVLAVAGILVTLVLPEPAARSLEDVGGERSLSSDDEVLVAAEAILREDPASDEATGRPATAEPAGAPVNRA